MADAAPVVVITGAAGGIGRALARRWAESGARVALLDRDGARLDALASQLVNSGVAVFARECDITRPDDCNRAMGSICGTWGGIDVLINNAGITHVSPFAETDADVVRRVMEVNFFGALHCTQAALPALVARRGLVIAISSVAGFAPLAGRCAYAASKHALHGLFETLRCEQAENGVAVMLVCPGFTRTEIEAHALAGDGGPLRGKRSTTGPEADPAAVAAAIYAGAQRRDRLLVLSAVGKLSWWLTRLWPAQFERVMLRRMRSAPQPLL